MSSETAWLVRGIDVSSGAEVEWWVQSGRLADRPVPAAEPLPGRYVAGGLVDAHCHLTLRGGKHGPRPAAPDDVARVIDAMRAEGVLAVRDTGAHDDTAIRLSRSPDAGVAVVACGRFLAPPDSYFPGIFEGVPAGSLTAAGVEQVERGATWVKVVADFPAGADFGRRAEENYPVDVVADLCVAVHRLGARVAAHVTLPIVGALVDAGVDSIEHGTAMLAEDLAAMAERGVAWTPTLSAVIGSEPPSAPPEWGRMRDQRIATMRDLLPEAVARGVPVLAGSDVSGPLVGEVARLAEFGLEPAAALASATTWARRFFGFSEPGAGAVADVVTYDADPRADPGVLRSPAAVLAGGHRVR